MRVLEAASPGCHIYVVVILNGYVELNGHLSLLFPSSWSTEAENTAYASHI